MLVQEKTGLVVVDVQGKLARIVDNSDELIRQIRKLILGCQVLDIPVLWLEQIPAKMGATVPEIAQLLADQAAIEKTCFGGCGSVEFNRAVESSGRSQWLVCGIEAHVCVYQTVSGLLQTGFDVEVVTDAVSSRSAQNRTLALAKMQAAGAGLTSVEMCLYELLGDADRPEFRQLLKIVK